MSESAEELNKRLFGGMFESAAAAAPSESASNPESVQADTPEAKPTVEMPQTESEKPPTLTEAEAIEIIQGWAQGDVGCAPSELTSQQEMVERLREIDHYRELEDGVPPSGISTSRFTELVRTYAPDAPRRKVQPTQHDEKIKTAKAMPTSDVPISTELQARIDAGEVWYDPKFEHWVIWQCPKCADYGFEVCPKCAVPGRKTSVCDHKSNVLNRRGKEAAGLIPIRRPEPPKPVEQIWKEADWWKHYRGVAELQGDGNVQWIIQNVVPAGVTVLTGMPKDGKSFVVLSFVRAITTGQPWLGRVGFETEQLPVLWLAAESGDSSLKIRCNKLRITHDKSKFICRTLTEGMPSLNDSELEKLIHEMKPYIVLETLVRFGDGEDEDDAKQASALAKAIFKLIECGARGVLAIHHTRKDLKRGGIDLEKSVRGSGDYTAMADAIWVIARDESLYSEGKGPNEVKMQGWGRDFNPYPMRLALTKKAPKDLKPGIVTFAPGICSIIDETGDLGWVDENSRQEAVEVSDKEFTDRLEWLVQKHPTITLKELANRTGQNLWRINAALKDRGWSKPAGRAKKDETHQWAKADTAATAA